MNIFITGSSGFIGAHFVKKLQDLLNHDDKVYLFSRKKQCINDDRFVHMQDSLDSIEKYERYLYESDYVFHLAANATCGSDADYFADNIIPTKKIVDILKNSKKLKNFIFISTIGAFDRHKEDDCKKPIGHKSKPSPTSEYGKSKLEAENYIKKSNIPYTIIRPTWVYGKNMRTNSHINKFVSLVYKKNPVAFFKFPGKVSIIHVEDLATALCNCLKNENIIGKEFFAATEAISIGDIFHIIYEKVYQKNINQIPLPKLYFIFSRLHHKLPVAVNNLFIDYLYAEDNDFIKLLLDDKEPVLFRERILDVIETNIYNDGYWVITGANSGIGYAIAKKLNEVNKKLILIDKDISSLSTFSNAIVYKTDLSNEEEIKELCEHLKIYKIFCLINNAGIGFRGGINELSQDQIINTLLVNIKAPLLITKYLIKNLIDNNSTIVNIASSVALNPLPFMSIYASSKSFIGNWSEALSYELRKTNTVITVYPAGTNTKFQVTAGVKKNEKENLLSPDWVAVQIIKAVFNKRKILFLGFKSKILIAMSKFLPRKINIIFWGKLFEKYR